MHYYPLKNKKYGTIVLENLIFSNNSGEQTLHILSPIDWKVIDYHLLLSIHKENTSQSPSGGPWLEFPKCVQVQIPRSEKGEIQFCLEREARLTRAVVVWGEYVRHLISRRLGQFSGLILDLHSLRYAAEFNFLTQEALYNFIPSKPRRVKNILS